MSTWMNLLRAAAQVGGGGPAFPSDVIAGADTLFSWEGQLFANAVYDEWPNNHKERIVDGNLSNWTTIGSSGTDNFVGVALHPARRISQIRYAPLSGFASRMVGGSFQASNTSPTSGYTTLHTIAVTPSNGWNTVNISDTTAYRWVRFLRPSGDFLTLSELEIVTIDPASQINIGRKVSNPTVFSSGLQGASPVENAFDGNVSTNAGGSSTPSFVGMEFNTARTIRYITIYPVSSVILGSAGFSLQGAASQSGPWTDLVAVDYALHRDRLNLIQIPSPQAFKCYRLWGGTNAINLNELEFYV